MLRKFDDLALTDRLTPWCKAGLISLRDRGPGQSRAQRSKAASGQSCKTFGFIASHDILQDTQEDLPQYAHILTVGIEALILLNSEQAGTQLGYLSGVP